MLNIKDVILRSEEEIMSSWVVKDNIVVSIICTTYNHADYIEDAIKGFLIQETDFAFEIIIHDDASSDDTAKIARTYQSKYPNIIKLIIQEENQYSKGGFRSAFFAERSAVGDYIARCEGDDYWIIPSKLQIQRDLLSQNNELVICGTNSAVVDEQGRVLFEDRWDHKGYRVLLTPCIMFRNIEIPESFWKYLRYIPNADTAFFYFLKTQGKCELLDIIGSAYRVHGKGIWSRKDKEQRLLMAGKTWELLLEWSVNEEESLIKQSFRTLSQQKCDLLVYYFLTRDLSKMHGVFLQILRLFSYKKVSIPYKLRATLGAILYTAKNRKSLLFISNY